ncbi:IS110 family transposase [Micromonospora sp. S4605]|uniref:IS110 family transposase n=1 Tax=Micromonospora sp. S4605 TaxID=1420897 RepID=UPI000D6F1E19|nr:IS110 family transposase [Micromonospora sp. S4605]PWU54082.1 IS110 family transposase [Micromonospora sp. S4605]
MSRVPVAWVGIDAGKQTHHAAAVDRDGRLLWSVNVRNDQAAIEALVERAEGTAGEVRWAVDLTSAAAVLLLAVLVATERQVIYVPGQVVNRMSGAFAGEAKTDARDARVIAETARLRRDLTQLRTPNDLVVQLSRLVGHRTDLMADWVRGVNRLRDLLTAIFPRLEQALDYSTRAALTLVAGYCTPAAVREAGTETLVAYMISKGVRRNTATGMVAKATEAAAAQTLALPGETITAELVRRQARKLLDLDREIKDIDKDITARFRQHPQAAVIESMPGMGPILGAEFITATGGDLAAFGSAARLATYAGLAPVPNDSGKRSGVLHRPRRYHRRLRHVFYMAAFSSLKREGPSRTFYQRKRAERQRHTKAMIALARRLVDVLWAMLRDNKPWTAPTPATATA